MSTGLAKGYTCAHCGVAHNFPGYVYANWDQTITHTCSCGAKNAIKRGVARLVKKPAKPAP